MIAKEVKGESCMKSKNKQSRILKPIFLFVLVITFVILSGCMTKPEVLKVNPEIYEIEWKGWQAKPVTTFAVLEGNISEVKRNFVDMLRKNESREYIFSADDELNFAISRGVFGITGPEIIIDKVERQGNVFTVYASYMDWRSDLPMLVHPGAIIPIGKLLPGDYKARLKVIRYSDHERKNLTEPEKELSVINFKVEK